MSRGTVGNSGNVGSGRAQLVLLVLFAGAAMATLFLAVQRQSGTCTVTLPGCHPGVTALSPACTALLAMTVVLLALAAWRAARSVRSCSYHLSLFLPTWPLGYGRCTWTRVQP